jgi:hypothetical protein
MSRAHERRNELARERGFRSYYQQRRSPPRITGPGTLARLPEAAQSQRQAAFKVLATMRRGGLNLGTAARRERLPVHVVEYYAKDALVGTGRRAQATASDRMYRRMTIISGGRPVDVDVRGSRQASLVGKYWNAFQRYLEGDYEALSPFAGQTVGGYELETAPDVLDELARQGGFDFDSIYRLVA